MIFKGKIFLYLYFFADSQKMIFGIFHCKNLFKYRLQRDPLMTAKIRQKVRNQLIVVIFNKQRTLNQMKKSSCCHSITQFFNKQLDQTIYMRQEILAIITQQQLDPTKNCLYLRRSFALFKQFLQQLTCFVNTLFI